MGESAEPLIIHQSAASVSGRNGLATLRVLIAIWLAALAAACYFTAPHFQWEIIAIITFGLLSHIPVYRKMNALRRAPGAYRILVTDRLLIRESPHAWFGKPFAIPLERIAALIVEKANTGEGGYTYRYYLRLDNSERIQIIEDYGFVATTLFDALLKLGVDKSITEVG